MIELAKAKVLFARQQQLDKAVFDNHLSKLLPSKANELKEVLLGIKNIFGLLRINHSLASVVTPADSGNNSTAVAPYIVVEACQGSVIIRPLDDKELINIVSSHENNLYISGNFTKIEQDLLMEMFALCKQSKLVPKKMLRPEDITTADRDVILKKYSHLPLQLDSATSSYKFDGHSYVDITGNRRQVRPDIDILIDMYVTEENKQRALFNDKFRDVLDSK